ncbi:SCO family protein [uncultured Sphingomonas sp.]|uniref:SCO family protein n=1 Tax=uncultured Sphingomonas sp. TaxID=158754 RepID=UPI0035CBB762
MTAAPVASFSLVDHHSRSVTEADFAGSYLLVYFGFTNCKVVCPRSLGKLSRVLDALGEKADRVTALYVTVDPTRDTPAVMRAYLERDHPRFLGLTGAEDRIADAKKAFRVFAEFKGDDEAPDGYVVPHSAIAYLMNPDGEHLDHFIDALDDEEVARRMAAAIR